MIFSKNCIAAAGPLHFGAPAYKCFGSTIGNDGKNWVLQGNIVMQRGLKKRSVNICGLWHCNHKCRVLRVPCCVGTACVDTSLHRVGL